MMNLAELIQATDSSNNQTRDKAETQLLQASRENASLLMLACSEGLHKDNLSNKSKLKAGLLIKGTLTNTRNDIKEVWNIIDEADKHLIKKHLLMALASPYDPVRNISAELISMIYACEHEEGKWEELIPTITTNMTNYDPEIKKCAAICLWRLCEEVRNKKLILQIENINLITSSIYIGMQVSEPSDVQILALNALEASLGLMKELLQDENARKGLIGALVQVVASEHITVKRNALQSLTQFVKLYYDYLDECWEAIYRATSDIILYDDQELAYLALKIWSIIAEEDERRKSYKYGYPGRKFLEITVHVGQDLVPFLLKNLLDPTKYKDDEYGVSIASISQDCLSFVVKVIGEASLIDLVGTHLNSSEEYELRAALGMYSCIMESSNLEILAQLAVKYIPTISRLLVDDQFFEKSLDIKAAAAIALKKTAQAAPQAYLENNLIFSVINELTTSVQAHPKVSEQIAQFWQYLGEHISQNKCILEPSINFVPIVDLLIANAFRDLDVSEYSLIDFSLTATSTLLLLISDHSVVLKYIYLLLENYKSCTVLSDLRQVYIKLRLLKCIQTTLQKFSFKNEDPIINELFNLGIEMFNTDNKVCALHTIAALASSSGSAFDVYSAKVWSCVSDPIDPSKDPELFEAVLDTTVELVRACPEEAAPYLDNIYQNLGRLYKQDDSSKRTKSKIIVAIGDITLRCRDYIVPHADKLSEIYDIAMDSAALETIEESHEEVQEIKNLRERILESYMFFLKALSETKSHEMLLNTVPKFIEFLSCTSAQQYNPTIAYLKNILRCFIDIAMLFGERAQQFLKKDVILYLINVLRHFSNNAENSKTLEAATTVLYGYL